MSMMKSIRIKKSVPFLLGYLSGFCLSILILSHMSAFTVWIESRMPKAICTPEVTRAGLFEFDTPLNRYIKTVNFHSENIMCKRIFENNPDEIVRSRKYLQNFDHTFSSFPESVFVQVTQDCDAFVRNLGYRRSYSKPEADFPLAYTIITNENIEQVERLLRTIYSPQNIYCIHVDLKSTTQFFNAVTSLSNCFPNVFLTSRRERVIYASFSRLRAELNCIDDLLYADKTWKYYLNMASSELPLKTNFETVKILKKLNGSNDIEEIYQWKLPGRFLYRHEVVGEALQRTHQTLPPPPHNLTMTKGVAYGAFSRKFLEFALTDQTATEFLNWTTQTYSPDEHFWSTLNNLYHNPFLQSPGGAKRHPDKTGYISRFIKWKSHRHKVCQGKYRHNICVFGFGDLPSLLEQKKLVANKFDLQYDPIAYACMEEILRNRTQNQLEIDA